VLCDESAAGAGVRGMSCAETLGKLPRGAKYAVIVGPEGGWTAAELGTLRAMPSCICLGLGPRILRADTAALAALALLQCFVGDWGDGGA
jgi:16S rRNA (uracil1498-N3)-methyltransferase